MNIRKLCVLTLLIALTSLQGCSDSISSDAESGDFLKEAFPWLKGTSRTKDMTPVDVELVDERSGDSLWFRIPKAYLTDKSNWEGGRQDRIKIETGLPDLEPRPGNIWITEEPEMPGYERKIKYFRNGLFIKLRAIESDTDPSVAGGRRKKFNNQGFGEYEKQSESVHGLKYYEAVCRVLQETSDGSLETVEVETCIDKQYEYYITPVKAGRPWVALKCTKLRVNRGGGCEARTHFRGWYMEYIFRRSQLHRWQEFDAGTRELLDRFLTKPDSENSDS